MRTYPYILDSRPGYLAEGQTPSLLLAPLGEGTVFDRVAAQLRATTPTRPTVLTTFAPTAAYRQALMRGRNEVEAILPVELLRERLASFPPTDRLLLLDPRCLPASLDELAPIVADADEQRWVVHLVAFEHTPAGTKEAVQLDSHGRVQKIQRYYQSFNWPLVSGVVASVIPLATALVQQPLDFDSLWDLRQRLVALGIPSQDLALRSPTFYLGTERGLLGLNEKVVLSLATSERRRQEQLPSTAIVRGPVIFQPGAQVDAGAVVIGPTVLGVDSRIGRDAIVAQSVIGAGTCVPPNTIVRQRVVTRTLSESCPALILEPPTPTHFSGTPAVPITCPVAVHDSAPPRELLVQLKGVFEAVVALAGLVLLLPVLVLVALAVRLDSRGPLFYGDIREGRFGKRFRCWKFRTMLPDADARQRELAAANKLDGPQFKLERDPRVTRVGAWLRRLNLDELPQLWNVVRGQMSLVGPRPSPFRENQTCVPWREGRLSVRPGITGLWQVCRHDRTTGDFHQWIHYDLLYVRHMSPLLDLKILFFTVVTLGGKRSVPLAWLIGAREPALGVVEGVEAA